MRVKLSVAIITKNEEQNIARCLESVKQLADDLLVVDSFSTDKTEEICLSYGARFIKNPFRGHIEQKNYALEKALYDHVLCLDADEALDERLKESIEYVKGNFNADAYIMNRLNNYCGTWIRHTGWYPDRKVRLLDRRKGKWGGRNPHDKIEMAPNSTISPLNGDILHYSFYTISQHVAQMNFFTDIMAEDAFKKGKKVGFLLILFSPLFKFVKKYFLQQGFRDGYYGFVISVLTVFYTFMKYIKLRELHKNANR